MCLVFFPIDSFSFVARRMVDVSSWRRMLFSTAYPCALVKQFHRICGRASSIPTNLDPMELLVFNFCPQDVLIAAHLPSDIIIRVYPLQSEGVKYEVSAQHLTVFKLSTERTNLMCIVPLRYFNPRSNLSQSSSSGLFTHSVGNETPVC